VNSDELQTARLLMRSILEHAGAEGISGPALLQRMAGEGLQVSRGVLYTWLRSNAQHAAHGRWVAK
jgi:hypothetical protein